MPANVDTMMYVGDRPWHGLGTKLEGVATSAEAIAAAGLNWEVKLFPSEVTVESNKVLIPGSFGVVRMDSVTGMATVGSRFHPLQNKEAFSFFDAIVGEKAAMYHTAGSLAGGRRIWILAKLPGDIRVVGDDIIGKYLLLSHAHDGTLAIKVLFTPIRVVCENTLVYALNKADNGGASVFSTRHTGNVGQKVHDAREVLGVATSQYAMFEKLSQRMAAVNLKSEDVETYFRKVINLPKDEENKPSKVLESMTELFETGIGTDIRGVKGTLWAAYNAVAEYADHGGRKVSLDRRANSLLFGNGARIKIRALDEAKELV